MDYITGVSSLENEYRMNYTQGGGAVILSLQVYRKREGCLFSSPSTLLAMPHLIAGSYNTRLLTRYGRMHLTLPPHVGARYSRKW